MEKQFVEKANNMFIKNYLFPFDLDYIKYFRFIFIGLKDKTTTSYYSEINKIIEDCSKNFSIKIEIKKEDYNDIINKLKQDNDIIKETNDNNNKNNIKEKEKEKEDLSEDNSYKEIKNVVRKLSGVDNNENINNKEKEENTTEIKNENNNIQFIFDLNPQLREEILRDLPHDLIGELPSELQNEYNRIMNKDNEFNFYSINLNINFLLY